MTEPKPWGTPATPEELAKFDEEEVDEIERLFPGRDGLELAELSENGDILVLYSTHVNGQASHGESVYSPNQEGYEVVRGRHRMEEANGRKHYIAKKMVGSEWADIGEGWVE